MPCAYVPPEEEELDGSVYLTGIRSPPHHKTHLGHCPSLLYIIPPLVLQILICYISILFPPHLGSLIPVALQGQPSSQWKGVPCILMQGFIVVAHNREPRFSNIVVLCFQPSRRPSVRNSRIRSIENIRYSHHKPLGQTLQLFFTPCSLTMSMLQQGYSLFWCSPPYDVAMFPCCGYYHYQLLPLLPFALLLLHTLVLLHCSVMNSSPPDLTGDTTVRSRDRPAKTRRLTTNGPIAIVFPRLRRNGKSLPMGMPPR